MSTDKKLKKGKVQRALKKVFSCCVPWTTSKVSPADDDVYKPSTKAQTISTPSSNETQKTSKGFMARLKEKMGRKKEAAKLKPGYTSKVSPGPSTKAQTVSTPSSSETQKVSESSPAKTQKTKKGFLARLKRKMGRNKGPAKSKPASTSKESPEEDVHKPATKMKKNKKGFLARLKRKMSGKKKTVLDQPQHVTQLGGAGMISGSESSAQTDTDVLKYHTKWEKMHTPPVTLVEDIYYFTDGDYLSISKYYIDDQEYESGDSDEEQSMIPSASFAYSRSGVSSERRHSVLDDLLTTLEEEEEEEEGLTQKQILRLIKASNDPPVREQNNDDNNRENMGFPNIGNTCYMNSTLQCLLSIPAIIKDIVFQENQWKNVPGSEMFKALSDLHHARLNKTSVYQKLQLLAKVKYYISRCNPYFDGNDQQDVHEFLMTLLAQMKEEAEMCQLLEESFHSPVAHLKFRVNRIRTCKTCGNQSFSVDELNCLSLVIGPQKSLISSLQQYFAASLLEYTCSRCEGEQASEHVEIQTLPKVLVLLVSRFDMLTAKKIKGHLAVTEDLSLSSFIGSDSCEKPADLHSKPANELQQQDDATYKLSGVVSHYGSSLNCGHYISNIRDPSGSGWLKCDDSVVKSNSWSEASNTIENHGYMFFYVRS